MPSAFRRFFSDRHGRLVIAQRPNLPLLGWVAFSLLAFVLPESRGQAGAAFVASAFAFT